MSEYSRRHMTHNPHSGSSQSSSDAAQVDQEMGNAAALDEMKVDGPFGRVFNRIIGTSENRKDTGNESFSAEDLQQYLDEQLKLADGEWFRSAKLKGAAKAIMEELDANRDGEVSWGEFQAMRESMRTNLVGDLSAGAGPSEVEAMANALFHELNDGEELDFKTVESAASERLPEGTKNAKLVAQLSALLVLDLVDLDEPEKDVRDRIISKGEWMTSAEEFSED
jgi:hypothetical protein